jgi:hypothetical protein
VPFSLEERVSAAIEARRGELLELVRQTLDAQVAALVDQEVARLNGRSAPSPTKRCTLCDRDLPFDEFAANRRQCRRCLAKRDAERRRRRREQPTEPEAP